MRIGVAPLDIDLVVNHVLTEKGLAGLSKFHFSDVIEGVAKAGFNHCEITLDMFQVFPISIDGKEIEKLLQIKRDYDITYSAHMPLLSVEVAGPNKYIRDGSIIALIESFNSIADLEKEIEMFVVHPSGETVADILKYIQNPELRKTAVDLFVNYSRESIGKFIDETGVKRTKIAIENVEFPLDATLKIVDELDTNFCLDTAHLLGNFSGEYDLIEIAEKYLDLTGEIHLQDFNDEDPFTDHSALGRGKTFPPEFLKILNQKDFKGPVVFELPRKDALISVEYIRKNEPYLNLPDIKDQPFFQI